MTAPCPYISHLLAVSALVWDDGGDEEQAIAALLHDVVEDTPTDLADVQSRFGARVASFVELCTDADPAPGEGKPPWRTRKERHFEHLRNATPDQEAGLLVVCADKVHNIESQLADAAAVGSTPGEQASFWAIFKGGLVGTLWYYRNIHSAIGDRLGASALVRRLGDRIDELGELWQPGEAEQRCQGRLLDRLCELDPAGFGDDARERYPLDADELTRRFCADSPLDSNTETGDTSRPAAVQLVEQHARLWYGGWPTDTCALIVAAAVELGR